MLIDSDLPPLPPSILRLASSLHRCLPSKIKSASTLNYTTSFKSAGAHHPLTASLLGQIDSARINLSTSLAAKDNGAIVASAQGYVPLLKRLILSCEIQPEWAVLDKKLMFTWVGGCEPEEMTNDNGRECEALMFDLTMALSTLPFANASIGCTSSQESDFLTASKVFKLAASQLNYLAQIHLPQWTTLGKSSATQILPPECIGSVCRGYSYLFLAHSQQMAVAKALQTGSEDRSKLSDLMIAKLHLGIHEMLNQFVSIVRVEAAVHYCRLSKDFLTYVAFQINIQLGFSLYFQAISMWRTAEKTGHLEDQRGKALRMLLDCLKLFEYRQSIASAGLPDIATNSLGPLFPLAPDVKIMKLHIGDVYEAWKKDLDSIYFEKVPASTPESTKLQVGVQMVKYESLTGTWEPDFGSLEPVPLSVKPVVDEKALKKAKDDALKEEKKRMEAAKKEAALEAKAKAKAEGGGGSGFFGWGRSAAAAAGAAVPADTVNVPPPLYPPPASAPGWGEDGKGGDGTGGLSEAAQSDEEMARELQRRLNMGEDI